jgi:hypothetical protein
MTDNLLFVQYQRDNDSGNFSVPDTRETWTCIQELINQGYTITISLI